MRRRFLRHWIAALVVISDVGAAAAATSEYGASLLIFPRVVVDGQRDTLVHITNGSNLPVFATCYYVRVTGEPNASVLADIESAIRLEPKQSTHWVASRGRSVDPTDPVCRGDGVDVGLSDCDGAGFDPGHIPPLPPPFEGELVCAQTDASGAAASGNALHGVAALIDAGTSDVAKYQAFGLRGSDANDGNGDLCLGSNSAAACTRGMEYDGCPSRWNLAHPAEGEASDFSQNATSITIAPCALDLRTQLPEELSLTLIVTNEFSQSFSAAASVRGNATLRLADLDPIFQRSVLASDLVATEIRSFPRRGFVAVAETRRGESSGSSTAALNLHGQPVWTEQALIRLPR